MLAPTRKRAYVKKRGKKQHGKIRGTPVHCDWHEEWVRNKEWTH